MTAKQFGGGLVSVEIKEPVYLLCMNHGDNRFEGPFMKAMNEALDYIEKHVSDRTEGALVTISSGVKIFSNGLNLEEATRRGHDYFNEFHHLLNRVLTFKIPTIAALTGHAFAGGCMFAMAHNYRIMRSDRGFICMNEIEFGSPLTPGMAGVLRCKLTPNVYRDMILNGYRYGGDESLKVGLVDAIFPSPENVVQGAIELAKKLAPRAAHQSAYHQLASEMYYETNRLLTDSRLGFVAKIGIKEKPKL